MPDENDFSERRRLAIQRCRENINFYARYNRLDGILHHSFQLMAIVLAGITPVLILLSDLPKAVQALPAALAAVFGSFSGLFHWRDDWVRFGMTAELLKSELTRYLTRSAPNYSLSVIDEDALSTFVQRMENLILSETLEWRRQAIEAAGLAEKRKPE